MGHINKVEKPKEDPSELKVKYTTREVLIHYWEKLPVALPIATVLIIVALAQFYFVSMKPQDNRAKAEVPTINVKNAPYNAKGDGVTNDSAAIQAALSAQVAGGTVLIPPGTYKVSSTIKLKNGVTLSGYGATLYMPPVPAGYILLDAGGTSNVQVVGLHLKSDSTSAAPISGIQGIQADSSAGTSGLTIKDLKTEGMTVGLKIKYTTNFTVENYNAYNDGQTYIAYSKMGNLKNVTLNSFTYPGYNNHNLYMERKNEDITFDGLTIRGGSGYSVHLYHEGTYPTDNGKRISFKNVRLENPTNQGIVITGYDDVTFENLYGIIDSGEAFIKLYTLSNLAINNFEIAGTPNMFIVAGTPRGPITNVNITNGVYHQPTLISGGSAVTGFTKTNVNYSSASFVMPSPTITQTPTSVPSAAPTSNPTAVPPPPTAVPTAIPTPIPTKVPTAVPTRIPTVIPTQVPTAVPTVVVPTLIPQISLMYEAEGATLYRAIVANRYSGYTGPGYVDYQNKYYDYTDWTTNIPLSGTYKLKFRYANNGNSRPLQIKVNGTTVRSSLSFPNTGSWSSWRYVEFPITLTAGINKIRATAIGKSGPNLDHLAITNY